MTFLLIFGMSVTYAQNNIHLIYFKDKANSPFSLTNPAEFLTEKALERRQKQNIALQIRDLPVNPDNVEKVRETGAKILYPTRWLNGLLIETDQVTLAQIQKLDCIQQTEKLSKALDITPQPEREIQARNPKVLTKARLEAEDYGESLAQIQLLEMDKMHQAGFHGEGMTIAIMDNGFQNVDINPAFEHLTILGTYDFVGQQENVFSGGVHGVNCLSVMGAYKPAEMIGGAYAASYYLFETENNNLETRSEEAFWLIAAERADSLGVDIISTSLGYYTFDDPSTNYLPSDTDGNTSLITRAADMAVGTGMIVVTSAGNEGQTAWGTITFPADGDSVLAVGSVDAEGNYYLGSSPGYSADGRVKPDVAAVGFQALVMNASGFTSRKTGTSFACPAVAALAAGVWQSQPNLTALEIMALIQKSGSQYRSPNSQIGYGIPSFERTQSLVLGTDDTELTQNDQEITIYPNPTHNAIYLSFGNFYWHKEVKLILRNAKGQEIYVQTRKIDEKRLKIELPSDKFSAGMYFLNAQVANFIKICRIIKQ